jgi:hypothetical protein
MDGHVENDVTRYMNRQQQQLPNLDEGRSGSKFSASTWPMDSKGFSTPSAAMLTAARPSSAAASNTQVTEDTAQQLLLHLEDEKDHEKQHHQPKESTNAQQNTRKKVEVVGGTTRLSFTTQKDGPATTAIADGSTTTTTPPPPVPSFYQPYWNLTCPLELSMFSGVHMGGGDYVHRAWAAREVAEKAVTYFAIADWSALEGRRIVFVGDSLMRQVFISMACLAWDRVVDYSIPWFHRRVVRTHHPNTVGNGPHSKFEEGRVLLRGGTELIYHHGIGGLLELGDEYQSHETETWIKACYLRRPLTALAPKYVDWSSTSPAPSGSAARDSITSTNVERERLTFHSRDVVLINASVHGARGFNLKNIVDLMECQKRNTVINKDVTAKGKPRANGHGPHRAGGEDAWPHFYYVVTGPRHFPTKTGAFEERLLTVAEDYDCINESTDREWQVEEASALSGYLPFIGTDMLPLQYKSGRMHVGGRDCLHWMQPGIPDLLAVDVLRYATARLGYR